LAKFFAGASFLLLWVASAQANENQPPVAHNQSVTTTENTAVAITLVATQANNDPLTYTVASQPTHGKLSGTAPKLTYTPAANYSGPDSFTFYANDGTVKSDDKERDDDDKSNCGGVRSNIATVSITVTNVDNSPPVAQNQSVTTAENAPVAITLVATQANNDPLTYAVATQPAHGTLTLNGTGSGATYTPAANYFGADSFTFVAKDGTVVSNTAAVSINVTKVNYPPVAASQSVTTTENAPVTITLVATQTNNDPLTYAVATQPAHGTLTLNGTGPSATYTPAANYFGPDSFTFTAKDGAVSSNIATVTITVMKVIVPPVAQNQSVTTNENAPVAITLVATQANNDPLAYAVATQPAHGTLTLNGTGPSATYTPAANYFGPDSFTFTASDGTVISNTATVSITVTKVNYPPVAQNQSVTTAENTPVTITLVAMQANNDPLTYAIVTQPAHGTLNGTGPSAIYTPAANYFGTDSFTFTASDGTVISNTATVSITVTKVNYPPVPVSQSVTTAENTALTITLTGTQTNNDALTFAVATPPAHGTLSGTASNPIYTPSANYYGPDSFTFNAIDGTVSSTSPATVSITVTKVNYPPVAQNQSVTTAENAPVTITLVATQANNDPLTYAVATQPAHGTVTLNGAGAGATYTPAANYFGPDSFTFTASDGTVISNTATVSITVTKVTIPPVAQNQSVTTTENAPVTITLVATQANNDPLTYAVATQPTHGTLTLNGAGPSATYTPAANYFGPDSFTFVANDGSVGSNTATVSITVTKVNYPPVPVSQSVTTTENTALTIALTGTQTNNDALTFAVASPPTHGTLSGTASNPIYTPASNYFGPDSFTFNAIDGTVSSTSPATVSITVTKVNYPPVAQNQSVTTAENAPVAITLVATQANNDPLTYAVATQPAHGTLTLNGTGPSATYTPAANYYGPDSFTFNAIDGTVSSTTPATVSITVTKVNYPPVPVSQSVTTAENAALTITLTGTQTNNDALTFAVASSPAHGTLSGTASNPIYTPTANYYGPDNFTFNAIDGSVSSTAPATVSITVTKVNYPPVVSSQSVTTAENTAINITLVATQTNNDLLTYTAGAPSHGTLTGTAPNLTYTPAANYFGPDSFTFTAKDGGVVSNAATVSITITKVIPPPVAQSQSVTTTESTVRHITLVATQANGDPLTYAVMTQPTHGTLTGTAPNVTYTPATNYMGPDSFTFVANDDSVTSNTATVSITVAGVNSAPVAQGQSVTTAENAALAITLVATQANHNVLAYTMGKPSHGTLSGIPPNVTYTPATNYFGPDSFTFVAEDGSVSSNPATVSIAVTEVNFAPVATNQAVTTVENTALPVTLAATQANGDSLTYAMATPPGHGMVSGTPPNVTYTPAANYFGPDRFTFTATDGSVSSQPATVSITVTEVNYPPVAADQSVSTAENTAAAITLVATQTNNDPLTFAVATQPAHGTLGGSAPNLTYTPTAGYFGPDSFTFSANDGAVSSNTAMVSITVVNPNGLSVEVGPDQHGTLRESDSGYAPTPFVLQPVNTTPINTPTGIDYSEYLHQLIISVNSNAGTPYNLETVNPSGTHPQFSSLSGITQEVCVATAKDDGGGHSLGGFLPGEVFCGSGVGGVIIRISPDGSTVQNPWVTLTDDNGNPSTVFGGALYIDRTGVWGGDLIATSAFGGVFRINSAGVATKVGQLPAAGLWEALTTIPNDPARWGPWAGKILAGSEDQSSVYTIDTQGNVTPYDLSKLGIYLIESFNIIPPGQNFYWIDAAGPYPKIECVPSTSFNDTVGDLLVAGEYSENVPSTLNRVIWNPATAAFETTTLFTSLDPFESATFAPDGITNQPPAVTPVTLALPGVVLENGLPPPSTAVMQWTEVSGPDAVTFSSPATARTNATFLVPGNYVLRLSASDGALSGSRDLNVTIDVNHIPTVYAGPFTSCRNPAVGVTLSGKVTDANPSAQITSTWSVVAGPGTVNFGNPSQLQTTANFSAPGIYTLQLTASDSVDTASDTTEVRAGLLYPASLPRDPADWWPLNSTPHEMVRGHHDIQNLASVDYGPGEVSQGLVCDGAQTHGFVPAHPDLDIGASAQGLTIELWANCAGDNIGPWLTWSNGGNNGVGLYPSNGGLLAIMPDTNGQNHQILSSNNNQIQPGTWQHFALTYDKTNGWATLYTNGIIVARQNLGIFTPQTSNDLYIGYNPLNTWHFHGSLDEITFYSRPLTPPEVLALYRAGNIGKAPLDANVPPIVNPGPDINIGTASGMAALHGSVRAGSLPGPFAVKWSELLGPSTGTVSFVDASQADTTATFSAPGIYTLELDADDGLNQAAPGIVTVRVGMSYANPLPAGLTDWWPLNGTPHEVVNGNHDIQFANGLTYGPGEVNQGLVFDGVQTFGLVPAHPDLDIGASKQGFSIELWVNAAGYTNAPFVQWSDGSTDGLSLSQDFTGHYLYGHLVDTAGQDHIISAPNQIQAGTWQHFALTYDKTIGIATLYVNGLVVAQQNLGKFTPQTETNLYIGLDPHFLRYFQGSLDEITFYTRPLNQGEVLAIYHAGSIGKPPINTVPPTVNAGPDLSVASVAGTATLNGSATAGSGPGPLTFSWSQTSGPGTTTFANPNQATTTATFSAPGIYVLELEASDGLSQAAGTVTVRVGMSYANALPAGLADWWPLNGTPHEVVNGNHDVQFANTLAYGPGEVNQGLVFDGISAYGRVSAHPDLDIGTSAQGFSIELWVNAAINNSAPLVEWSNGTNDGLSLNQGPNADIQASLMDTTGQSHSIVGGNQQLKPGTWQHVSLTYDKTTGLARLYIDGLIVAQQNLGIFTPQTSTDLYMGYDPRFGAIFQGSLDEITFYTRPLTPAEVLAIYNAGSNGKPPINTVPPTVNPGPDLSVASGGTATLNGSAAPGSGPGLLTVTWSQRSGPGMTTFANPNQAATTATFSAPGLYELELDANDGLSQAVPGIITVRVGVAYPNPPLAGLADWWPLNGLPHEVVHGNHDVQFVNNLAYGPGEVGQGLVFDGISAYGWVPAHPDLDICTSPQGLTIELWVNAAGIAGGPIIEWSDGTNYGVHLNQGANSDIQATLVDITGQSHIIDSGNQQLKPGTWQHFTLTYDKTTGLARFYTNGIIVAQQNLSIFTPKTNTDLYFGYDPHFGGIFQGSLDEITFYNRPLTPAEVLAIYNSGANGKPPVNAVPPTVNPGPDLGRTRNAEWLRCPRQRSRPADGYLEPALRPGYDDFCQCKPSNHHGDLQRSRPL